MDELKNMECEMCSDTGLIEAETIHFGREYYSKELKRVVCDAIGTGKWATFPCPDCTEIGD